MVIILSCSNNFILLVSSTENVGQGYAIWVQEDMNNEIQNNAANNFFTCFILFVLPFMRLL